MQRARIFMSDLVGDYSVLTRLQTLLGNFQALIGLCGMKTKEEVQIFLPEEVVMNILSWLPAKDVLRYRLVCKLWKDLTSSNDFIDLHFRHCIPMILKEEFHHRCVLVDGCWESTQTRSKVCQIYGPANNKHVLLSQNGLIVINGGSYWDSIFIIYNPIYRDVVKITVHWQQDDYRYKGKVCGVFFHPAQKEYCILWRKILSLEPHIVQFRILNLESDPKWRVIATQNVRILDEVEPVVIDNYIYWIVHPVQCPGYFDIKNCDIMEYDIITEEFRVIHSPVYVNYAYNNVNLFDIDGTLSLIYVVPRTVSLEINICTLNDGDEQLWASRTYLVSRESVVNYYIGSPYCVLKAIAFRKGELVLHSNGRLYVCNLLSGKVKKFGETYDCPNFRPPKFWSHVANLVSLKNWKSDIHVADEDENNQP